MSENDKGVNLDVPRDKQLEAERLSAKGYPAEDIAKELGCSPDEAKEMVANAGDKPVEESSVSQEPQEAEEVTKDLEERVANLHKIADEDLKQDKEERPYSEIMAEINKNLEENKPFEEQGNPMLNLGKDGFGGSFDDILDETQQQTTSEAVETLKDSHEANVVMANKEGANAIHNAPITGTALGDLENSLYGAKEVAGIEAKLEAGVALDAKEKAGELKEAGVKGKGDVSPDKLFDKVQSTNERGEGVNKEGGRGSPS